MCKELEDKLIAFIENDVWMLDVLRVVRDLHLPDCWIGAGFVRNKVWDELHGRERSVLNDVDVIYYDDLKATKEDDALIEHELKLRNVEINWSVKNQSRMHLRNKHEQYKDCKHAISFWPETATAVAVRLNDVDQIECIVPYGLKDVFDLVVMPTPKFNLAIYQGRIQKKGWKEKWNQLEIKTNYTKD